MRRNVLISRNIINHFLKRIMLSLQERHSYHSYTEAITVAGPVRGNEHNTQQ